MERIVLVDGNNLVFRSYYATAYNGNFMKNSKGFPTNALFGFVNMIKKIINEENPTYIMVAFDKGKTFRHSMYSDYKGGRIETPDELKLQMPIAKELLTYMGITYYEVDNYEADDIIGTFAAFCDDNDDFVGTIVSSDKDLLQLVSNSVDIKLLKSKDFIRYNPESFRADYGIEPINIIDLKSLMGDSSDNIMGVKGIGEKTALKLLHDYKSLDGIYDNIDSIGGKLGEKLVNGKDSAYLSYKLATICKSVPMSVNIDDVKYRSEDSDNLNRMYEELEFYSFLRKNNVKKEDEKIDFVMVHDASDININSPVAVFLDINSDNYHNGKVIGMGVYGEDFKGYIPLDVLLKNPNFLVNSIKYTYDFKRMYVALKWLGINVDNVVYDNMIASYLLEYNVHDDIANISNASGYNVRFFDSIYDKKTGEVINYDELVYDSIVKAKFIFETREDIISKLEANNMLDLFNNMEMPLARVLGDMEFNGVNVSRDSLESMGVDINKRLDEVSNIIFDLAGGNFNISSPVQLGEVLFEKLGLPHGKKGKTGYSTAASVLEGLKDKHPIIEYILEYRMLTKLYNTYIVGLMDSIHSDNKIHTIYKQTLTRTGRLSSIEPNLQNIPARNEYGKLIRKAFVANSDSMILSSDYSQIELRILASVANVESLISAFKDSVDVHAKTASDIFGVPLSMVDSNMRRIAKAVNFGIIYGISGFGLASNIGISQVDASRFIQNYFNSYPGIKEYMDSTISKAYECGYVLTLFNRKRSISELSNKNYMIRQSGERMALNTPIQGTSADIIKMAMVMVDTKIKENNLKSRMILQVHDELIFDCFNDEVDTLKDIVKDVMENVVSLSVKLEVSMSIGKSLYDAK